MPAPKQIDLYYADGMPPLRCTSVAELVEVLEAMHERVDPEYPIHAVIATPQHNLRIGLGSDPTFVEIHLESNDGEHYATVAISQAEGRKSFYGCGGQTLYQLRNLVPWADARLAVQTFLMDQRLDHLVRWEKRSPDQE